MIKRLLTENYSESVKRQTDFEWIWYVLTIASAIMIVVMPSQFYLWIILVFAGIMSLTAWRAGKNASVPVVAVYIIESMSSFFEESKINDERFHEHEERANRFGIVDLNNEEELKSEVERVHEREDERESQRKRIRDFNDSDDDDEVWSV